jgi:Zn-dependent peptidase ImmA (M78 family)
VKHEDESRMGFILARRHEHSRRFDVARLVGDRLFQDTGDKWVPATQSFTARQKFQRAFAAEFLCPSDELERRFKQTIQLDDIDDVVGEISEEFNVSPKLVINHLVNIGLVHASAIEAGWAFVENPG